MRNMPKLSTKQLRQTKNAWSKERSKKLGWENALQSMLNKVTPKVFDKLFPKIRDVLQLSFDASSPSATEAEKKAPLNIDNFEIFVTRVVETAVRSGSYSSSFAKLCCDLDEHFRSLNAKERFGQVEETTIEGKTAYLVKLFGEVIDDETYDSRQEAEREAAKSCSFMDCVREMCQEKFEDGVGDDGQFELSEEFKSKPENDLDRRREVIRLEQEKNKALDLVIGNITFMGELFKVKQMPTSSVHGCIGHLLQAKTEKEITFLKKLLETIGSDLDRGAEVKRVEAHFEKMKVLVTEGRKEKSIAMRVVFMLEALIKLREEENWGRKGESRAPTGGSGSTSRGSRYSSRDNRDGGYRGGGRYNNRDGGRGGGDYRNNQRGGGGRQYGDVRMRGTNSSSGSDRSGGFQSRRTGDFRNRDHRSGQSFRGSDSRYGRRNTDSGDRNMSGSGNRGLRYTQSEDNGGSRSRFSPHGRRPFGSSRSGDSSERRPVFGRRNAQDRSGSSSDATSTPTPDSKKDSDTSTAPASEPPLRPTVSAPAAVPTKNVRFAENQRRKVEMRVKGTLQELKDNAYDVNEGCENIADLIFPLFYTGGVQCLVYPSRSNADDAPRVEAQKDEDAKNSDGNKRTIVYVGWAGEFAKGDGYVLELSSAFAKCLGLKEGSSVDMCVAPVAPIVNSIEVEPLTQDDWEIIELNGGHVEEKLLSQIAVLSSNLVFPLWVQKTCVRLRVVTPLDELRPVRLAHGATELLVKPKMRARERKLDEKTSKTSSPVVTLRVVSVGGIDDNNDGGDEAEQFSRTALVSPLAARCLGIETICAAKRNGSPTSSPTCL
eukprot:g4851.t1